MDFAHWVAKWAIPFDNGTPTEEHNCVLMGILSDVYAG